jgi:hypothetical protein
MIYKNSFGKRVTIPISRQQDPSPEDSHEYPSDAELSIEKLQELL